MRDLALNEGTRDPLVYEDCQFGGAWDDTFHVQGDMWQAGISRLVSPTEYELWPNGYGDHPTATPGDSVVIVNADTGIPLGHARVLSGDRLRMVVDRVVEIPKDGSTPTSPVRLVIDDTDLGERFVVRRSLASTQVRPHGSFVMEGSTLGGYWPIAGTPFAFDNTFIGNQMDWFQAENHPAGSEFNWFFAGNTFRPSSNGYVPTLIAGPVRQAVFWANDLPGAGHITFSGASLYLRDNTVKGETVADQANVTEPDNTLVIDGQGPIVASISLLNADTGQPIVGYDPIADSQVIALAALPTRHLKLRANVLDTATAVAFDVSTLMGGKITTGNAAEAFSIPWTADDVRHTVVATPRNGAAVGRSLRITFYPTDLMSSWQTGTLGSPCSVASCLAYQSGKYLVVSGSGDTGEKADRGARWAHTTMGSDGDVVVRVVSQTVTDLGAKAGVVLRKDTAADASYALLAVTPAQGLVFETRASPGAAATVVATGSFPTLPYWLKLSRAGESVSAFVSLDGTTWSSLGDEQKVQLSSSAQWGVVVSSHRIDEPSTARFDSVSPLVP
ncbi:MAG: hypothetical protein MUC50_03750 [Myxococcota bacterium]|nr:hypothetical protein [Myxococcota bacterium]